MHHSDIGKKVKILADEGEAKAGEIGTIKGFGYSFDSHGFIHKGIGNKCRVQIQLPPYDFEGKQLERYRTYLLEPDNLEIIETPKVRKVKSGIFNRIRHNGDIESVEHLLERVEEFATEKGENLITIAGHGDFMEYDRGWGYKTVHFGSIIVWYWEEERTE